MNKVEKLVIIGIDGFDKKLLFRFIDELPNFKNIIDGSPNISFNSTYPYDSETAWATIYTGLNPAKTGVVSYKNPFVENKIEINEKYIYKQLKGRTFWDYAGRKVCILFPHAAYPAWQVNGIMVSRSMKAGEGLPITSYPKKIFDEQKFSSLNTVRKIPSRKNLDKVVRTSKELIINELNFGLDILKKHECNLFFIYSSTIDYIQHFFWNYFDENDPTFPGNNPYKNIIKEFYIYYDRFIGKFLENLDENTGLIILSDHGHGMRPVKIVNINRILKQHGFLSLKSNNKQNASYILQYIKESTKAIVTNYQLGEFAKIIFRKFPSLKEGYVKSSIVDWENTLAHVSDPSGIKSYSYGGIVLNRDKIPSIEKYEEIRDNIINKLRLLKDPVTEVSLFKWVRRREELYDGEYLWMYPDIVFELRDEYGVGWEICKPLITNSKTHLLQPGGHKVDTAVLLLHNLPKPKKSRACLMDVTPSILNLLGIKEEIQFDGKSIFT